MRCRGLPSLRAIEPERVRVKTTIAGFAFAATSVAAVPFPAHRHRGRGLVGALTGGSGHVEAPRQPAARPRGPRRLSLHPARHPGQRLHPAPSLRSVTLAAIVVFLPGLAHPPPSRNCRANTSSPGSRALAGALPSYKLTFGAVAGSG